jgi:recombination associated protein RdgC
VIKSAIVYKLTKLAMRAMRIMPVEIVEARDPEPTQWGTVGWIPFFNDAWRYDAAGGFLFNTQFRDRVLPAKVISTALDAKCVDVAARQGNPVSKKQRMELKDVVTASLLPTAFIKPTDVPVIVISHPPTDDYFLLIGTSSASKADSVVALIRETLNENDKLIMTPLHSGLDLDTFLHNVLTVSGEAGTQFEIGTSAVLGFNKAVVRVKNTDMGSEAMESHIAAGFRPTEVHMYYGEADEDTFKIGFALTDRGVIKRIKFSAVSLKDVEESSRGEDNEAAYFDGTVALVLGEFREMLQALRIEAGAEEDDEL